jgi:DNA repair exonuclease SbcCD ATPase subunit
MADENSSDFRFDADNQEPESFYHEELKDLRVEKLSQRVTLLTILLPCLLAVAVYFGYQDLAGRASRNHDAVSLEIQRLNKELEDLSKNFNEKLITFSTTLSTQDKDFGTSIDSRLFAMNKDVDILQNSFKSLREDVKRTLKLNRDTIEKLKASKVDKKQQAVAVEKINASITLLEQELLALKTLEQDLQLVSSSIAKLESKFARELKTLRADSRQHGKNYKQLQASLTKLSNDASDLSQKSIDKDAMALEVFKLRKNIQNEIAREISNINQRLDTIQSEVIDFENMSGIQKQSLKKISRDTVSQPSGAASKTGTDSVPAPVKSDTITEKDLIE